MLGDRLPQEMAGSRSETGEGKTHLKHHVPEGKAELQALEATNGGHRSVVCTLPNRIKNASSCWHVITAYVTLNGAQLP